MSTKIPHSVYCLRSWRAKLATAIQSAEAVEKELFGMRSTLARNTSEFDRLDPFVDPKSVRQRADLVDQISALESRIGDLEEHQLAAAGVAIKVALGGCAENYAALLQPRGEAIRQRALEAFKGFYVEGSPIPPQLADNCDLVKAVRGALHCEWQHASDPRTGRYALGLIDALLASPEAVPWPPQAPMLKMIDGVVRVPAEEPVAA